MMNRFVTRMIMLLIGFHSSVGFTTSTSWFTPSPTVTNVSKPISTNASVDSGSGPSLSVGGLVVQRETKCSKPRVRRLPTLYGVIGSPKGATSGNSSKIT